MKKITTKEKIVKKIKKIKSSLSPIFGTTLTWLVIAMIISAVFGFFTKNMTYPIMFYLGLAAAATYFDIVYDCKRKKSIEKILDYIADPDKGKPLRWI